MSKVLLASLALIALRTCDIGGPRVQGPIQGTRRGDPAVTSIRR